MTSNILIYNLYVPGATRPTADTSQATALLSEGVLNSDVAAVEPITPNAGTQTLSGRYIGQLADVSATELRELSGAAIEVVPIFNPDEQATIDGYYALESANVNPRDARISEVQEYSLSITGLGTRRSHHRTVRTNATAESNPFGTASTAEIGIPARARTEGRIPVRWYNESDGSLEAATVQRTVTGEHDDIDIYDATEPSFGSPTLVYDIPYHHEWPVDCRVWDDRDGPKLLSGDGDTTVGDATVGDATVNGDTEAVRWQRVFASDHDYAGVPIVENDRLRLEWEEGYALRAYRWDTADQMYARVDLGSTSWRLLATNIKRIGGERIGGQAEFRDESTPSTTHNLNWSVKRGYDDVLWTTPANESSPPQGLIDRLDPIAHDSQEDPAAAANVIETETINR